MTVASVSWPVGIVLTGMGALIAACAGIGALVDAVHPTQLRAPPGSWGVASSAAITLGVGVVCLRRGRSQAGSIGSRRQATLAVAAIWLTACVFGGLPFVLGAGMAPADALFEAASGLTTTGATALGDIEGTLGRALLLWRSLIQWLGGMGIVVLFVAVFPSVGVGGKHMFQGEVTGASSDAMTPRIRDTSFALWKIYASLTVVLIALLAALGMDPFEAVCHALATVSTGGFSTRDASVAAFDDVWIEVVLASFMFVCSINFALFFVVLRTRSLRALWRNAEVRVFVAVAALAVLAMAAGTTHLHGDSFLTALRHAFFMIATFMSSTGFATTDHAAYPSPVIMLVLLLMLMGGCSGSTAGGLKVERVILLVKQAASRIRRSFRPNVIDVVRVGRQPVTSAVLDDVAAVSFLYLATAVVALVALTLSDGVDVPTALGAVLTSISNMGPAPFYRGADNFAAYSSTGKLVCAAAMVLGRLEFFTLLALVTPTFWRR